ncbi:MAG: hypothetical protein ACJAS1_006701 [Oleiphilaceae bacterium]|jgi:hypothetical protein
MDKLRAMRLFVRLADLGSFTRVAEHTNTLIKCSINGFDGDNYHHWLTLSEGNLRYMEHYFISESGYLALLDKNSRKKLAGDAAKLYKIRKLARNIIEEIQAIRDCAHLTKVGIKEDFLINEKPLEESNSTIMTTQNILNQQVVNANIAW